MMASDPHALATALRLDRQFQKALFEVEQRCPHLSRHYQMRIKKWMQCLTQPISNNTWKRTRNQYCQLLLYQLVDKGRLAEPFNSEPCPGPLQNLPANALAEWRTSQRSSSRWRAQAGVSTVGPEHARKCNSSSPAGHPCCGMYGGPSCAGLGARPGEVSRRSVSARAGQAMVYRSIDSHLGSTERHPFAVDSRDTGTSPVCFELKGTSAVSGSYNIPQRQAHSAPRKTHRTNGSAQYIDINRKVQQCQDVLRRQTLNAQTLRNRQPLGSLGDSLNLPQPVLQVDCLRSKTTAAYGDRFSPAGRPADLIDVRQLQRPASPPALTRDSLKLQSRSMYRSVPAPPPRCTALSSPGTYSTLTDDDSTTDPSYPSTTLGDFSTRVPSAASPSSESSPNIRSAGPDSPICLDAHHQLSHKNSVSVMIPEVSDVPDVTENQRILAAHLHRMKAADENLRRTTQLRNAM